MVALTLFPGRWLGVVPAPGDKTGAGTSAAPPGSRAQQQDAEAKRRRDLLGPSRWLLGWHRDEHAGSHQVKGAGVVDVDHGAGWVHGAVQVRLGAVNNAVGAHHVSPSIFTTAAALSGAMSNLAVTRMPTWSKSAKRSVRIATLTSWSRPIATWAMSTSRA